MQALQNLVVDHKNKNVKKEKVHSLEEFAIEANDIETEKPDLVFENVVGQDSLNRFDLPNKLKNKRRKKRKPNRRQNNV